MKPNQIPKEPTAPQRTAVVFKTISTAFDNGGTGRPTYTPLKSTFELNNLLRFYEGLDERDVQREIINSGESK